MILWNFLLRSTLSNKCVLIILGLKIYRRISRFIKYLKRNYNVLLLSIKTLIGNLNSNNI